MPGQFEDSETGLCYNRFRYYDPDAAIYISADPIGLEGGLNSFAYARNPVTWCDPFGLVNLDPTVKSQLSGLTTGPGVYHIETPDGKSYTGMSMNVQGRLCGSGKHDKAEKLLNTPGAKVTVQSVNPGTGTSAADKARGVKVTEQNTLDTQGGTENSIPALSPAKQKQYNKAFGPSVTGTSTVTIQPPTSY